MTEVEGGRGAKDYRLDSRRSLINLSLSELQILLCFFAVISLALGFYTDFGTEPATVPCANPPPGREGCDAGESIFPFYVVPSFEDLNLTCSILLFVSLRSPN